MNRAPVPPELGGERADRILAAVAGVSRAHARAMIDEGSVSSGGEPVAPRTRLSEGTVIEYPDQIARPGLLPEPVEFGVVYEDDSVVLVDKPAGLVVHPGAGRKKGTLAAGLLHRYPDIEGVGAVDRWGIVHRLDQDTSGLLVVARTESAFERLSRDLAARLIKRHYSALVIGRLAMPRGTIDAPIGRDPADPRKRRVLLGGRPARTHYRVNTAFDDVTLVDVELETGRTHQIRVHLASIEHPVVGDPWYGRPWRVSSPRVFLHAARLGFAHPLSGEAVEFEAPLPADLAAVLAGLVHEAGRGQ